MNEQSQDRGSDESPRKNAETGGELRRDRQRLRQQAKEPQPYFRRFSGRSQHSATSDGNAPDAIDESAAEELSPFAALNLEPSPPPPVAPQGSVLPSQSAIPPELFAPSQPPLGFEPPVPLPLDRDEFIPPAFVSRSFEPPGLEPPVFERPNIEQGDTFDTVSGRFRATPPTPPVFDLTGADAPFPPAPEAGPAEFRAPWATPSVDPRNRSVRGAFGETAEHSTFSSPGETLSPATDWNAFGRLPDPDYIDHTKVLPARDEAAFGGAGAGRGPGSTGHPVLGPLVPRLHEEPEQLRMFEIVALILAIALPPAGLILAIVASARGTRYRGWPSNTARAAIVVGIVMTILVAIGLIFFAVVERNNADARSQAASAAVAHTEVVAASAEFCAAVAEAPALFAANDPDFGWPQTTDPAGYLPAVEQYSALWQSLATIAPDGIALDVQSASSRVVHIESVAQSLNAHNRSGDLLELHAVEDFPAVAAYTNAYCAQ